MATISAGLAATIREWFSEGENVTTVETAEKVHLDEVRVRKRPQRKKLLDGEEEFETEEIEESVAEVAQAVAEPLSQVETPTEETTEAAEMEIPQPGIEVVETPPTAPVATSAVIEELPAEPQVKRLPRSRRRRSRSGPSWMSSRRARCSRGLHPQN